MKWSNWSHHKSAGAHCDAMADRLDEREGRRGEDFIIILDFNAVFAADEIKIVGNLVSSGQEAVLA